MTDDETDPTPEDEKRIRDLELFVENTGHPSLPSEDRDSFDQFLRKITRDSLTYDQMTFEVVNGRGQFPIAFLAVDAATIRLATTPKYFKDVTKTKIWGPPSQVEIEGWRGTSQPSPVNPEDVRYVQVLDGRVVTTYTEEEMGFAIRNPRTYIRLNGYGVSELELLINTVTAHLWSEEYNRRFFSQGSAPKGIIHFEGNISQEQLTAFRRQWHAQIMGVYNAWRTPIIAAPAKLQYTNLQVSNKQMEYAQWMDYLIKLICAVYLIDPTEIGFDMRGGATTGQTPMFETHHEQRQKMSKDRGLRPLLRFVQNEINKNIIYRLYDGRYKFEFVGLDAKTEEQLQEMRLKEVQNFKTIDEVRAEFDLPPLGAEKAGDVIMNSAYLSYLNQLQMQKMQQQPPMGGGGGGDFGQEDSGEEQPDFGQEQDFGGGT
jgi:hypothetical protein